MLQKLYDEFGTAPSVSEVEYREDNHFKARIGRQLRVDLRCIKADGFLVDQDYLCFQYGEVTVVKELLPSGFIAKNIDEIIKYLETLIAHTLYFESRVAGSSYYIEHTLKEKVKCWKS